jgi:hypothetical protein
VVVELGLAVFIIIILSFLFLLFFTVVDDGVEVVVVAVRKCIGRAVINPSISNSTKWVSQAQSTRRSLGTLDMLYN